MRSARRPTAICIFSHVFYRWESLVVRQSCCHVWRFNFTSSRSLIASQTNPPGNLFTPRGREKERNQENRFNDLFGAFFHSLCAGPSARLALRSNRQHSINKCSDQSSAQTILLKGECAATTASLCPDPSRVETTNRHQLRVHFRRSNVIYWLRVLNGISSNLTITNK